MTQLSNHGQNLDDAAIRTALIARLGALSPRPKKIIEELHVHNGNAIADVVAVYRQAHCYEIKGRTDNIYRLSQQSPFFDLVFPRITLVTTENHLKTAERLLPNHWGILQASVSGDADVKMTYVRPSRANLLFDKRLALLTLWKREMHKVADMLDGNFPKKATRKQLIEIIATNYSQSIIAEKIAEQLTDRSLDDEAVSHISHM